MKVIHTTKPVKISKNGEGLRLCIPKSLGLSIDDLVYIEKNNDTIQIIPEGTKEFERIKNIYGG